MTSFFFATSIVAAASALAVPPSWSSPAGPSGITFSVFEDGPLCLYAAAIAPTTALPRLYIGGEFAAVAGVPRRSLAVYDGAHWSGVAGVVSGVGGERISAITAMPIEGRTRIILGGFFDAPRTLDGIGFIDDQSTVQPLPGPRSPVGPHAWFGGIFAWNPPSGPDLVVTSGVFPQGSDYAYRYTSTGYALMPPGLVTVTSAFAVFDDGAGGGPALYIGVPRSGDDFQHNVTRWNGAALTALVSGAGWVNALCVHDDGSGPALYAGGNGLRRLRRGNAAWEAVPGAPFTSIHALLSMDDGSGPALYVAGQFTGAPGVSGGPVAASNIIRLRAGAWEPLGAGLTGGAAAALAAFDEDGPGPRPPALYAAGKFTQAGGAPAIGLARWGTPFCRADFNGRGGVTVQDIFDFLAAYFAGAPAADINGENSLTAQDIFDFLIAYFVGCA